MDEIDKKILNLIQEEFPVARRPFSEIGNVIGISEKDVLERVRRLKEKGYIRRIGPILERKKLGLTSVLCGARVSEEMILKVAEEINKQSGVTHNYEREGELNLWFTITKETKEEIDEFLGTMERKFSLKIYRFPEKRVFKIKTFFPV